MSTDISKDARYYEGLTASVSNYLIAIVSFTAAYVLLVVAQDDRAHALSQLAGLAKLLAVREIALREDLGSDRLTKRDLTDFFPKAANEAFKSGRDDLDPHTIESLDARGFTSEEVGNALVVDTTSRFAQRRCKAAVVPLPPGEKFNFATFQIVGKTYWVNSENVQFITFDGCVARNRDSINFLVFRSGRDTVVAFPKYIEKEFLTIAPPLPFTSFEFYDQEKLLRLLPGTLRGYADLSESMVMVHLAAIEHFVLRHATTRTGVYYTPAEFDLAVSRVYDEQDKPTNLFGMNASPAILIRLGPLLLFILSFEMWRRVRRIPLTAATSSFWFATDTHDAVGLWTARLYALIPLISATLIYFNFSVVTDASFVPLSEIRRLYTIIQMGTPISIALGWIPFSLMGTCLLVVLPIQFAISGAMAKHLLQIVDANRPNVNPADQPSP